MIQQWTMLEIFNDWLLLKGYALCKLRRWLGVCAEGFSRSTLSPPHALLPPLQLISMQIATWFQPLQGVCYTMRQCCRQPAVSDCIKIAYNVNRFQLLSRRATPATPKCNRLLWLRNPVFRTLCTTIGVYKALYNQNRLYVALYNTTACVGTCHGACGPCPDGIQLL